MSHEADATVLTAPPARAEGRPAVRRAAAVLHGRSGQSVGIVVFFVAVVIVFSATTAEFRQWSNVANIVTAATIIGIVAMGQTVVIVAGGFDLSVAGVAPLGSVIFAIVLKHGASAVEAMAVAVAGGAMVGAINGQLVTRLRINPLIATLGMLSVTAGTASAITNGVAQEIVNPSAGVWGDNAFGSIQWGVIALVGIGVWLSALMNATVFGRSVYAVGGNREGSRLAGIRVNYVVDWVYVISGACSAFAGVVAASQLLAGAATIGTDLALNSIAAVVLGGAALTGGVGGVGGTMLGVLLLGTISNGLALMQVQSFYQQIVTGAVLLIAVCFGQVRRRRVDI